MAKIMRNRLTRQLEGKIETATREKKALEEVEELKIQIERQGERIKTLNLQETTNEQFASKRDKAEEPMADGQ